MIRNFFDKLLEILGLDFPPPTPDYFEWALTHSSYANENNKVSYERLEFLGDSIVGFVIAQKTFELFNDMTEGEMAKVKAVVGSEMVLSEVSRDMKLSKLVMIGKSLESASSDEMDSIYADVFESTMAAVFLNYGFDVAYSIVSNLLVDKIRAVAEKKLFFDYKTILQEYTQEHFSTLPEYVMVEESGPPHRKMYTFEVLVNGESYGHGSGRSKKSAEQIAAKVAYGRLRKL